MWKEFKAFAMRGPVLDMAIGIILGAAFGQIITSLVNDIIMPPIGLLLKGVDFSNLFVALSTAHFATLDEAKKAHVVVILYGHFINTIIDFVIVAFCMFMVVKWFSVIHKPAPAAPTTRDCPYCVSSIPLKATRCPHCTSQLSPA
ncbi:MAG TPA: large conductance mechanosensitive channel protein MscL [Terriglobia bacterium]|nr:large conductance mechanosensitive channel protein MscL [Terriglobia bacterium]